MIIIHGQMVKQIKYSQMYFAICVYNKLDVQPKLQKSVKVPFRAQNILVTISRYTYFVKNDTP